ncbi:MAG: hypothetical protein IT293_00720 [Deltaproteobacteria bacterium]|nr:hypothetical protein [Deltaproteobacteria bacterium]
MSFAVGSLVRARGREWVVLPESEADLLVLRPLGGTDDEGAGIYTSVEPVEPVHGEDRTKRVIFEIYDDMQRASTTGEPYRTRLDPPPADPRVAHAAGQPRKGRPKAHDAH